MTYQWYTEPIKLTDNGDKKGHGYNGRKHFKKYGDNSDASNG